MSDDGRREKDHRGARFGVFYFDYYTALFAITTALCLWQKFWAFAAFAAVMTGIVWLLNRGRQQYGGATFGNAARALASLRRGGGPR